MMHKIAFACLLAAAALPQFASAHGFAGKRFFPATPTTEDPFVADELSLPTITQRKLPASDDEPATTETSTSIEFSKRITPNLGLGLETSYLRLKPEGEQTRTGFDNLGASLKYQLYESDAHEAILSAGVDWDIGGSGSKRVGAESFSSVTPTVFFGKGLGDLPESVKYLRPLAVTGLVGIGVPTDSAESKTLDTGFALEYSIPYLQSSVKDIGLKAPFNRMIPLVEVALQKPLEHDGGPTTGTVNPGILWAGRYVQLAFEAVIPYRSASGSKAGFLFELHFFLDDMFPRSLGRALISNP